MRKPKFWLIAALTGVALVSVVDLLPPWPQSVRFEIWPVYVRKLHSIHEFTDTGIRDASDPWIASVQLRKPQGASSEPIFSYKDDDHWVQVRVGGRWRAPECLTSLSDVNTYGLYNYGPLLIPVPERAQAVRLILKWRYRDLMERASATLSFRVDKLNTRALCRWVHCWLLWPLREVREQGVLPYPRFREGIIEIALPPRQDWDRRAPTQMHHQRPGVEASMDARFACRHQSQ